MDSTNKPVILGFALFMGGLVWCVGAMWIARYTWVNQGTLWIIAAAVATVLSLLSLLYVARKRAQAGTANKASPVFGFVAFFIFHFAAFGSMAVFLALLVNWQFATTPVETASYRIEATGYATYGSTRTDFADVRYKRTLRRVRLERPSLGDTLDVTLQIGALGWPVVRGTSSDMGIDLNP